MKFLEIFIVKFLVCTNSLEIEQATIHEISHVDYLQWFMSGTKVCQTKNYTTLVLAYHILMTNYADLQIEQPSQATIQGQSP